MTAPNTPDPALARGLSPRRRTRGAAALDGPALGGCARRSLGRRDALRMSGLGALGLALSACGVKGKGKPSASTAAPGAVAEYWAGKTRTGKVSFANWPLYMDRKKPELARFTEETGIQVSYAEVILEMAPWFAKVQPQLQAGQSIGYDLMVITNSLQFNQFRDAGFLAPLDHTRLPNFLRNAGPKFKDEDFDKGNVYSVPWATGITGIAYDRAKVGREITKISDLWDPRLKGKVGMFADPQELANFGLLTLGLDPATAQEDDWKKAAEHLKDQKRAGLVRNYFDQAYIDALGSGEVWACMAWSGDVFQKNVSDGTNLTFVIPEEGGTIWTDNFAIPITAAAPVDAMELIDFFYRPEIAASLTEYINYACPVPAAKDAMKADAAKKTGAAKTSLEALAASPLIFPSDADYARLHYYVDFDSEAQHQAFEKIFQPIVLG